MNAKLDGLKKIIKETEGLAIAFSGGVDSTFLLSVALNVLKQKVIAIIVISSTYTKRELDEAVEFCENNGVNYKTISSKEINIPNFKSNPTDRCYYCKHELFGEIKKIANENGYKIIADGTNADDIDDFRPGMRALKELRIISPLKQAGLTKKEIRKYSKDMNLKTWDKQSFACLASRIPYGTEITLEKLRRIEKCESVLYDIGFKIFRVRYYGETVRIEVGEKEIQNFFDNELREKIVMEFKKQGFIYITLDLQGYRLGSMNETISPKEKQEILQR